MICCILILRPTRFITEKPVVRSNQEITAVSETIEGDNLAAQRFVAPYSHLADIKIYLINETPYAEFRFILFDADYNPILDKNVIIKNAEGLPGLYAIELNQDVEAGKEYCYMLQGISEGLVVAYEDTASSGTDYNKQLFYCGAEVQGMNIITEYDYELPFGKAKAFAFYAAIILLGVLITFLSKKHYEKYPEKNNLLTVETVWKRVAGSIITVAAIVCMLAIWPCNLFKNEAYSYVLYGVPDIIFFEMGVLLTAAILLYGVYHKRENKSNDMGLSILRDRWTDYLQAVFFALAIQASVHYMNAVYENQHTIAYLEMLVYLGLSLIATYKRKEIFNRINLIYAIIAAVAGYLYYNAQVAKVETEDEMQILQLSICAAVIIGIVIINTVTILLRKQVKGISKYGIIVALFFVFLIIFRNTRGWTIYLACVFSLYYLRMIAWDKKERLLCNICNGIVLNFWIMAGYSMLHRPYLYKEARFPFVFHTETISAEYLSLAVCAAFAKLMQACRKGAKLSCVWKEMTSFGAAVVYLILTLSRTGYLAVILMLFVAGWLVCFSMRHKLKSLFTLAAVLAMAVVICFAPIFTLQRIVPAVVAQPEMFEIEWIPDDIKEERNMDSWQYMTIRRFVQMFEMRVLGMSEDDSVKPYRNLYLEFYGHLEQNDKMLVASANPSGAMLPDEIMEEITEGKLEAYASGRLEIFKLYISHLNMTGHDKMALTSEDGSIGNVHAHNTYIQAAYDHGIPMGIVFTLFIIYTLIQAAVYYNKRKEDRMCSLFPFTVVIAFAVAGLTEWIFHPCNPLTLGVMLASAALICDVRGKSCNMADKA